MNETVEEDDRALNRIPVPTNEPNTGGDTGQNENKKALPPDPTPKEDGSAWLQV